ncbi:serine--tRNA ligase [Candidatus Uhrbacteria bacterium]|nr:serine--tRNA ligase [Candidatus Uhrbacteria bacterium]
MLDIKFIRENEDTVRHAITVKRINLDLDRLLACADVRTELIQKGDALRAEKNKNTEAIQKASGDEREKIITRGKEIKEELHALEQEQNTIEKEYADLMLLVPNIPSHDTPIGSDASGNTEVVRWGTPPAFSFPIKDHVELGENLDLIDLDAGVKTSGFRGYYLKNEAALLHMALQWHALNKVVAKGFTPFVPPTLVKEFALTGSGHFPGFRNEIYQIANPGKLASGEDTEDAMYLVGTSEPSLLAYQSDNTFEEKDLPIKMCGFSQCYRSEVGSYGKDTKGLFRLHEFVKVEQVIICKNDTVVSNQHLEEMRGIVEELLQELNLAYRVIQICTGDMGAGKHKMYDIETWMPSRNDYCETHSDSNLTDWQARRLNIKYKTADGRKEYVHMLNNTVIASPRILIALLECYQQEDGSVVVPEVLRPYLGMKNVIRKKPSIC